MPIAAEGVTSADRPPKFDYVVECEAAPLASISASLCGAEMDENEPCRWKSSGGRATFFPSLAIRQDTIPNNSDLYSAVRELAESDLARQLASEPG